MKRNPFFDTLNKTLLIAAAVLFFLLRSSMGLVLAGMLIAFALMRTFSRDYAARQRENDLFRNFFSRQRARANAKTVHKAQRIRPVYEGKAGDSSVKKEKQPKPKSTDTHKIYKCPNCKQVLRVPRGKGKILITCQNCGHKFEKKT